jgi:hypothetical protein
MPFPLYGAIEQQASQPSQLAQRETEQGKPTTCISIDALQSYRNFPTDEAQKLIKN